MELRIKLTGTRPMLQHNGRMANPIDPHTRELAALTGKRKKTDIDLVQIMKIEARGACWEDQNGNIGLPNAAVWRCIYDAAKAFKLGEDVKRALSFEDLTMPLLIGESIFSCEEWIAGPDHIDYRPVKIAGRKTMRARPKVQTWSSVHTFDLLTDVINVGALVPVLERAGRLVGVGDWRPIYGTFSAELI